MSKILSYFSERQNQVTHPLAKQVLALVARKKTNLCLSLDITTCEEHLHIANQLGPHIAILKTHIDILDDFTPGFIKDLQKLAKQHEFFIFEDRKFADIGNTAKLQYQQGIYKISSWADFITCHALPGDGMIKALAEAGLPLNRAGLMLIQMSSSENLLNANYQEAAIRMACQHPEFIAGLINQERTEITKEFLCLTPGISLTSKKDSLGQQYKTPVEAMAKGSDILIIGRGLYHSEDPVLEAKKYLQTIQDKF